MCDGEMRTEGKSPELFYRLVYSAVELLQPYPIRLSLCAALFLLAIVIFALAALLFSLPPPLLRPSQAVPQWCFSSNLTLHFFPA